MTWLKIAISAFAVFISAVCVPGCSLYDSSASFLADLQGAPQDSKALDSSQADRLHPADSAPDSPLPDKTDPPEQTVDSVSDYSSTCPTVCINNCKGGICELDCSKGCTCPTNYHCQVNCKGSTCTGTIDCKQAASCFVSCSSGACTKPILCGAGSCTVHCSQGSCKDDIACAGKCKVTCGNFSCDKGVHCGSGRCDIDCYIYSCKGKVDCQSSCGCDLSCWWSSCKGGVSCPKGCSSSSGCSTKPSNCKNC